jgi:hypothetical protein
MFGKSAGVVQMDCVIIGLHGGLDGLIVKKASIERARGPIYRIQQCIMKPLRNKVFGDIAKNNHTDQRSRRAGVG